MHVLLAFVNLDYVYSLLIIILSIILGTAYL